MKILQKNYNKNKLKNTKKKRVNEYYIFLCKLVDSFFMKEIR